MGFRYHLSDTSLLCCLDTMCWKHFWLIFWFFCFALNSGIDIISLLQWLGVSDKIVASLSVPGVGHAAIAYLLYKLATPVRYAVTIAGTRLAVNVLRRWGHLPPIPEKNKIRSLVKEGQQKMKEKYDDIKKSNQDL